MRLLEAAADLLYPPKCAFCGALLDGTRDVPCPACQEKLPWLAGEEAERKVEFVSLCVSPLRYQGEVPESIRRFKFSGMHFYCRTFGPLMAQCAQDRLAGRWDVLSWVPVSQKRKRERGYDQCRLLAREAGRVLGAEPVPILEKFRNNPAQSGLDSDSQRRANVLGVYRVPDPQAAAGKRILLLDDIVTTGETLSECARTLWAAGAADVVCVTLAKARG